jgi:hypothetical protein
MATCCEELLDLAHELAHIVRGREYLDGEVRRALFAKPLLRID